MTLEKDSSMEVIMVKPPIGIMPKFIWLEKRLVALDEAIRRYEKSMIAVPVEWATELAELLKVEDNTSCWDLERMVTAVKSPAVAVPDHVKTAEQFNLWVKGLVL